MGLVEVLPVFFLPQKTQIFFLKGNSKTSDAKFEGMGPDGDVIIGGKTYEKKDLKVEEYREYCYPGGNAIRIDYPVTLWFRREFREWGGNAHRVLDTDGQIHYMPPGWICLTWKNRAVEGTFMSF